MLLDLGVASENSARVPAEWARFVVAAENGFIVRGDSVAAGEIFLYTGRDNPLVSDHLGDLLSHLHRRDGDPKLSQFGISSLLHHGLIPVPHTEYEDIYLLCIGDVATVRRGGDGWRTELRFAYPWLPDESRGDRQPSEDHLLNLLTKAVEREVARADRRGFLMLSSGKDSVSLALALAELGYTDIPCVTYSSGEDDPEAVVSADVCRRLGLSHQIVAMPEDERIVREVLIDFFTESTRPGTDLAQVPYVFAVAAAAVAAGTVFDGDGNDSYMGYLVSGSFKTKMRYRIRGRAVAEFIKTHIPVDSPLNYLARSRPEVGLPGRTMRPHEIRAVMPEAVDTSQYWSDLDAQTHEMSPLELFACVTVRHVLPGASLKKHILAADALGYQYSVPWSDRGIADYYFNLPEADRFDAKAGVNKILLRSMLEKYLGYDSAEVGKHYFTFDGSRFISSNRDFVWSEIRQCALWDGEGLDIVAGWLDQIESRPMLYHAILDLFMVSGWLNHSRFVSSAMLDAVKPADPPR